MYIQCVPPARFSISTIYISVKVIKETEEIKYTFIYEGQGQQGQLYQYNHHGINEQKQFTNSPLLPFVITYPYSENTHRE